jgi:hypothetical protein
MPSILVQLKLANIKSRFSLNNITNIVNFFKSLKGFFILLEFDCLKVPTKNLTRLLNLDTLSIESYGIGFRTIYGDF